MLDIEFAIEKLKEHIYEVEKKLVATSLSLSESYLLKGELVGLEKALLVLYHIIDSNEKEATNDN